MRSIKRYDFEDIKTSLVKEASVMLSKTIAITFLSCDLVTLHLFDFMLDGKANHLVVGHYDLGHP